MKKLVNRNWTLPLSMSKKDKEMFIEWNTKLNLLWNTLVAIIVSYQYLKKNDEVTPIKLKNKYEELKSFGQAKKVKREELTEFLKYALNKRQWPKDTKVNFELLPLTNKTFKTMVESHKYSDKKEKKFGFKNANFLSMSPTSTSIKNENKDVLEEFPSIVREGILKKCCTAFEKKKNKFGKTVFPTPVMKLYKDRYNVSIPFKKATGYKSLGYLENSKKFICQVLKGTTVTVKNTYPVDLGTVTNYTILCDGRTNEWNISICHKYYEDFQKPNLDEVGLDLGVKEAITASNGMTFNLPNEKLAKLQKNRKKQQRKLSRAFEESDELRILELKKRIAKIDNKIVNIRNNFSHNVSKVLANHKEIYFEKLNIQAMTKSAKGTTDSPGKNVAAKRGLNKAILDKNWGRIKEMTVSKSKDRGGKVFEIDPKFTSQICNECNHKSKENRKSQAEFKCVKCGHENNADVNAAKNILKKGKKLKKSGDIKSLTEDKKKEAVKKKAA
tara:strand:+ start:271 stop:1767 length:1497 start_codon:yes stop_codon:yes gene_type:complete